MNDSRLKQDNKGLTLIELIVVVLIVGIASAIIVLSINYAYDGSANRTAKKLSAMLDLTRVESMSMVDGKVTFRLEKKSDGIYGSIIKNVGGSDFTTTEELGSASLKIYSKEIGGSPVLINNGDHIDITYKKSSGAFTCDYEQIQIEGNKTAYVRLVKDTGRNYVE